METTRSNVDVVIEVSSIEEEVATILSKPDTLLQEEGEEHAYMPGEVLFTFVDTTAKPARADRRVTRLLEQIRRIAGADLVEVDGSAPKASEVLHPHIAGAPLTLRFRAAKGESPETFRDHVKEIVDRINANLEDLQHEGILVSSAAPNWITSSSGGGGTAHGGPGTVPDAAPAGAWPILVPPAAAWQGGGGPDDKVIVAVLDSSPGREALATAAQKPQFQANALMQSLAQPGVIVDWNRFVPPPDIPSQRQAVEEDHGLFVSGIIHQIAPHAEIHLLHVLDDAGLGHMHLMLEALDYCLALAHAGRRVVVNLSLYLNLPPGGDLWDHWFGQGPLPSNIHPSQHAAMLDALDEALEQRIDLLLDAGVVVVAAAGNDALRRRGRRRVPQGGHPEPRLPADYDGVICVVAANRETKIAGYSNRADIPATGNSVATYGGEGILHDGHAVVPPGSPRDGMVSVYTDSVVHGEAPGAPNNTGWVYWSGTSFATPVISGIAANVLAKNDLDRKADPTLPRLTPRQVLTNILDMSVPPADADPALGCPYVPVTQVQ